MQKSGIVGIFLIGIGIIIFSSFVLWGFTRNTEPVNADITLSKGLYRYNFYANVRYTYTVELEVVSQQPLNRMACTIGVSISGSDKLENCSGYPLPSLHIKWKLFGSAGEVAHSVAYDDYRGARYGDHEIMRFLGSFQIKNTGLYNLNVKIEPNYIEYKKYRSKIQVSISPEYTEIISVIFLLLFLFSMFLVTIGVILLLSGVNSK